MITAEAREGKERDWARLVDLQQELGMQAPPYSTLHATNLRKMVPRYLLLVGVVLLVGQGFLPPVIAHSESYTLVDFISDNEIYSFLPDTLTGASQSPCHVIIVQCRFMAACSVCCDLDVVLQLALA